MEKRKLPKLKSVGETRDILDLRSGLEVGYGITIMADEEIIRLPKLCFVKQKFREDNKTVLKIGVLDNIEKKILNKLIKIINNSKCEISLYMNIADKKVDTIYNFRNYEIYNLKF